MDDLIDRQPRADKQTSHVLAGRDERILSRSPRELFDHQQGWRPRMLLQIEESLAWPKTNWTLVGPHHGRAIDRSWIGKMRQRTAVL